MSCAYMYIVDAVVNFIIILILYGKICLIQNITQSYSQLKEYVFNIPISLPKNLEDQDSILLPFSHHNIS